MNTDHNNMQSGINKLINVTMDTEVLKEQVKQIPERVSASKAINKGQVEIIQDLIEATKDFKMEDLVKAMMAKGLLGAGDLAGLSTLLSK